MFYVFFIINFCFFSAFAYSADAPKEESIQDRITHQRFPSEITIEKDSIKYQLAATGVTNRLKQYSWQYSIAHYLQKPIRGQRKMVMDHIFSDSSAKEFILQWLRDMEKNSLSEEFMEAFQANITSDALNTLEPMINKFLGYLGAPSKGDIHIYRWLPKNDIEVEVNGQFKGRISDKEFAKALWQVWFGSHSIVNKNQLLSLAIERQKEESLVIINPKAKDLP